MIDSAPFESEDKYFARGRAFWDNYLKGRPSAPAVFFERLFNYHQEHHGEFGTVHDVGAGNGPYADKLRLKFQHVIISDIASDNVDLARDRLGTDGFSYRTAPVEKGDDIPDGSVDMVFATNVMHFCDQKVAMEVIAKQLRPGGTFACAGFATARFEDAQVQDIYKRIHESGGRDMLKRVDGREKTIEIMARTQGPYNVAPLNEALFLPGAQRIYLNMDSGGLIAPLPPEIQGAEPLHTGVNDVEVVKKEEGWGFMMDLEGIREHVASFPFAREDSVAFGKLWREMEDIVKDRQIQSHWPAKVILATRR